MTHRSIYSVLLICAAMFSAACAKPKEEDCRRAIANIRNVYGTANFAQGVPPNAAVRSCRGSASKEAVRCVIAAKSIQELESCAGGGEFLEAMKGEAPQTAPTPTPAPAPAPTQAAPVPTPEAAPAQTPTPAPGQTPTPAPAQTPTPAPGQAPTPAPAQPTPTPSQTPPPAPGQAQPQPPPNP
jgi:outer membrane biosynthesis protein TonB